MVSLLASRGKIHPPRNLISKGHADRGGAWFLEMSPVVVLDGNVFANPRLITALSTTPLDYIHRVPAMIKDKRDNSQTIVWSSEREVYISSESSSPSDSTEMEEYASLNYDCFGLLNDPVCS